MSKKYPFKYKGVHHCKTVILTCIDFRFWREAVDFAETELGIKDFDFPSLPGAAKAINECNEGDISHKCISIPCDLHRAEKIVIVNHANCGAYDETLEFDEDIEAEQKFHENELRKAKEKILEKYPDKEVVLVYAKLVDDEDNTELMVIS